MNNIKQYIKNYYTQDKCQVIAFVLYFMIFVLIAMRFMFARHFPIQYYSNKNFEDYILVNTALNFENSRNTLTGVLYNRAYVGFLRICMNYKLYYSDCVTFLWLIAATSIFALVKVYKRKSIMSYIAFLFVLWHPIAFNYDIGTRLARYNLIIPASLMALSFTSIYLMLIVKRTKGIFAVLSGALSTLSIIFYSFLIENGINIVSLVTIFNILTILYFFQDLLWNRRTILNFLEKISIKIVVIFIPLIFLCIFTNLYTLLNYRVYGVDVVNVQSVASIEKKGYEITDKDDYDVGIIKRVEEFNRIKNELKENRNVGLKVNDFNSKISMLNGFKSGFASGENYKSVHNENEIEVYESLKLKNSFNEIDKKMLDGYNSYVEKLVGIYKVISRLMIIFTYVGFVFLLLKTILNILHFALKHFKIYNKFFGMKKNVFGKVINITLLILPVTFFIYYIKMTNSLSLNIAANVILNKDSDYKYFLSYGQEYLSLFIILFITIYFAVFYKKKSSRKDFYNIIIDKNIKSYIRIKNLDRII